MSKENSFLLYEGPSQLDGGPIIATLTGLNGSANPKTGGALSIWIMRGDEHPMDCINTGLDRSMCGVCPFRKTASVNGVRICYVNMAPVFGMFHKYRAGRYNTLNDLSRLNGWVVRAGAYGDPAALPLSLLQDIKKQAGTLLGYTHQWSRFPNLKKYFLASCQDQASYIRAKLLGFKTFRIRGTGRGEMYPREIECMAKQKGLTCAECKLCTPGRGPDISTEVHGLSWAIKEFNSRYNK